MSLSRIDSKIVYHIHDGNWKVGETYHIGKTNNEFLKIGFDKNYNDLKARSDEMRRLQENEVIVDWTDLNTCEISYFRSIIRQLEQLQDPSLREDLIKNLINHKNSLKEIQQRLIKETAPGLNDVIDEYRDLVGILRNYLLLVREDVFEDVRINSFSALPSRQKCLWVIEDNGNINKSIEFWWNELNRKGKLLKLEVNGDLFQSDENYLRLRLEPIDSLKSKAESYWQGKLGDDPTYYECLFIGGAKVLEVVRENYAEFEAQKIGS